MYSSADPRKGTLLKIGKQRISVVVSGKHDDDDVAFNFSEVRDST
jgi:hypothetical protein